MLRMRNKNRKLKGGLGLTIFFLQAACDMIPFGIPHQHT
jgi:hypothetical protein